MYVACDKITVIYLFHNDRARSFRKESCYKIKPTALLDFKKVNKIPSLFPATDNQLVAGACR
jgi:hypothetical protein